MKRIIRLAFLAAVAAAAACTPRERTLVILSTNDMHAQLDSFPKLAAAVEACRDTAELVVLVDAGDRWTGNAYCDLASASGMPMIEMMNRLGFEAATLGNHEFDLGQAYLGRLIDSMDFEVVCANVKSDTTSFPQLPPYVILERGGLRIGFVGVVTNYEGPGHPAGNEESFVGLEFPDPQQMAVKYAAELRPKCDLMVLISHMGDQYDAKFLEDYASAGYDFVIGGHTHKVINKRVNGTLLEQTGKYLANIGVTTVRFKGKKVESIEFRNVPLTNYTPDPAYQAMVDRYRDNPELNRVIGSLAAPADKWGLANWMAAAVADEEDAEVGFYHIGGVRLESLPAGDLTKARLFDLEPFGTRSASMEMTPADMRLMILSKFNDAVNIKEAARIDLVSTTPYMIDAVSVRRMSKTADGKADSLIMADSAVDVRFPALKEGQTYQVGISDYVYRNYRDMHYTDGDVSDDKVLDMLIEDLVEGSPLKPDNTVRQTIVRK